MREPLTKEEFLDKKNIDLIREVREAMMLKSELDRLSYYFYRECKGKLPICFTSSDKARELHLFYGVHVEFVNIIEMIKNGELILKK